MNKKIAFAFIAFIMLFSMFNFISALSSYQQNLTTKMDAWDAFWYKVDHGSYIFTAWGEANDCDTDPGNKRYNLHNGQSISCNSAGCSYNKCAIDIWEYDSIYLSGAPNKDDWTAHPRTWDREIGQVGASFSTPSSNNPWFYVEVYCCPESGGADDHETRVYTCNTATGGWTSRGTFSSDEYCSYDTSGVDLCWCNDEDENFYVDVNGGVHCRPSTYSSVTNGVWCPQPECNTASDCGTPHYTGENYCYNGNVNKNQVTYTCDDHECNSHDNNILQQTCTNGCTAGACNGGNGSGKANGESCSSNSECLSGYCDPRGIFQGAVCADRGGGENNQTPSGNKITLTWMEFFSTSDEDLYGDAYYSELKSPSCNVASDCPSVEGYNVSCKYSQVYAKRYINYVAKMCDKQMTWLNEFTDFVRWLLPLDYEGADICTEQGEQQARENSGIKFCIAESTTTYGKLWDKTLQIVGGFGIPAQWVLISTLGILLLIIVLILQKI